MDGADQLRPDNSCIIDIPKDVDAIYDNDMRSGVNVHLPINFDDGIRWLAQSGS